MIIQPPNHAAPEGGTPAPDAPPAGQPVVAGAPPAGRSVAAPLAGAPGTPPRPRTLATDLPPEALAARLERDRKAQLRREFGTEDIGQVKAKLAKAEEAEKKLAEYEAREAEAKRAQMTELDRVRADLETERTARTAAEARIFEHEQDRLAAKQDAAVRAVATKYVDPEFLDYAKVDLQRHIKELEQTDPRRVKRWTDADTDAFFKELVKRKPRLAPAPPAGTDPAAKPAPRAPVRTGTPPAGVRRAPLPLRQPPAAPARGASLGDAPNGKTMRPGLPNSMTPQEVKDELRRQGRKPWA